MRKRLFVFVVSCIGACIPLSTSCAAKVEWTESFDIDKADLANTGENPYFILRPGYEMVFEDGDERLVITVLDETKVVDGVETRIVEERESDGDRIKEISRNYFAISRSTNSVFYFGEDSAEFNDNGEVESWSGSWLAGEDGARAGLIMPGLPLIGARYYQEIAPGEAMDRAEIVSVGETVEVPAGKFQDVLKTEESSPLEPFTKEIKLYARGVGLLRDGGLELVKYGTPEK